MEMKMKRRRDGLGGGGSLLFAKVILAGELKSQMRVRRRIWPRHVGARSSISRIYCMYGLIRTHMACICAYCGNKLSRVHCCVSKKILGITKYGDRQLFPTTTPGALCGLSKQTKMPTDVESLRDIGRKTSRGWNAPSADAGHPCK